MKPRHLVATLACAGAFAPSVALAHVIAGNRVFPVTLTFDDPGVADEVSIPSFVFTRSGIEEGSGPTHEYDFGIEYNKTITANTMLSLDWGWNVIQTAHAKTQTGFENLALTGKWQAYTSAEHEFVLSLGITREFGGTGTEHTGADPYGATEPTLYFGKGLGDLPIGLLRPLAITGEISYAIADKRLKATPMLDPDTGMAGRTFNNGNANQWSAGLSVQYSIPYLQQHVKDVGLGGVFSRLIPLVEITWTSPATSPSLEPTTWTLAPGLIYQTTSYQIGVEALIPLNKAAGTNVGVVGLFHVFLDDLLPNSLGRPIL